MKRSTKNTVVTSATSVFDFNLDSLSLAVKSAKLSMKEAQREVEAASVLPVYDAKREQSAKELNTL